MFVVIHLWPKDVPTIMPEAFREYDDARRYAEVYTRNDKDGHSYVAVTLPGEVIEVLAWNPVHPTPNSQFGVGA